MSKNFTLTILIASIVFFIFNLVMLILDLCATPIIWKQSATHLLLAITMLFTMYSTYITYKRQ